MQILNIEEITWALGEPADWPKIFEPGEVPFACMICHMRTATHKMSTDNQGLRINIIACPDCIHMDAAHIKIALRRK